VTLKRCVLTAPPAAQEMTLDFNLDKATADANRYSWKSLPDKGMSVTSGPRLSSSNATSPIVALDYELVRSYLLTITA
jgi:hypothetical protein